MTDANQQGGQRTSSCMLPHQEENEHYKRLSLDLYKVMEKIGVTTDVRDTQTAMATLAEILLTIAHLPISSAYLFGSYYEGTYTFSIKNDMLNVENDMDFVFITNILSVVTNVSDNLSRNCYLVVPEKHPGYVKLQPAFEETHSSLIMHDWLCLKHDKDNKVCLVLKDDSIPLPGAQRQGPANSVTLKHKGMISMDYVYALKCDTWPDCALEWLSRPRHYGWPSKRNIEKCISLGFLVVPASHPKSEEREFQWRISFSEQERFLVTQFNTVQLMCYVLLKRIKKDIIQQQIKEDTLTSYHCKTCMLYMLENTPCDFWVPENLASCLLMCLKQIQEWVKNDNCPNYFIPEENMFDRIRSGKLKLQKLLDNIVNSYLGQVLPQLKIVEEHIYSLLLAAQDYAMPELLTARLKLYSLKTVLVSLTGVRNIVFYQIECTLDAFTINLKDIVKNLEETKKITTHSEIETRTAVSLILPLMKVQLLICEVVEEMNAGDRLPEILTSSQWSQQDPVSSYSKLKQATAMMMLGHYQMSINVLGNMLLGRSSLCGCNIAYSYFPPDAPLLVMKVNEERPLMTKVKELLQDYFLPCVAFVPFEKKITPTPINYEMIRNYSVPDLPISLTEDIHKSRIGLVDGNFLTLFVLYLNLKALGLDSKATKVVKKLILLLNSNCVSHKNSCLNLLGWIHKERGDIARAVQCFKKSLSTNPIQNSAIWHLCFLICTD